MIGKAKRPRDANQLAKSIVDIDQPIQADKKKIIMVRRFGLLWSHLILQIKTSRESQINPKLNPKSQENDL